MTEFFASLIEIVVAAWKFSTSFPMFFFVTSAQADAPTTEKAVLSACLQLFHDLWHTEYVDCTPEIVGEHMQTHFRLHIR